jgi:hypothetical protein
MQLQPCKVPKLKTHQRQKKKKDIHESTNKKKKDEKEQSNIVWTKNMYIYIYREDKSRVF